MKVTTTVLGTALMSAIWLVGSVPGQAEEAGRGTAGRSEKGRSERSNTKTTEVARKATGDANPAGVSAGDAVLDAGRKVLAADRANEAAAQAEQQQRHLSLEVAAGSLGPEAVKAIQAREASNAALEEQLQGDAPLAKDERHQVVDAVAASSQVIWSGGRNNGAILPAGCRLGSDVAPDPANAAAMAAPDFGRADARAVIHDCSRTLKLERLLASTALTADQRTGAQRQFNDLLNRYYIATAALATAAAPR